MPRGRTPKSEAPTTAPPPPSGGLVVTGEQLAQLLGIDERTVRKHATEKLVVRSAAQRGKYDLIPSVQTYCRHIREQAAGRFETKSGINAVEENALLKRARRVREERETQLLEDKLLTFEEVEEAAGEILTVLRVMILGLGDAIAAELPHLSREEIERVRIVTRNILRNNSLMAWEADPHKLPPPLPERIAERQGTGAADE